MIIYFIHNNLTDNSYIGQTKRSVNRRFNEHCSLLKRNIHSNPYLQRSWNKYGENNFIFDVLEDNFNSIEDLNNAEIFWIQYLRTMYYQNGYNLNFGGDITYSHSDYTKK